MSIPIAIITGGYDAERVVSLKSAEVVARNIPNRYTPYVIEISERGWHEQKTGSAVDLNDFSILIEGQKVVMRRAFMCLHGSPAEDGLIQGYLEILKIPYTGCGVASSALTMDKKMSKLIAQSALGIDTARYISYRAGETLNLEAVAELQYPVFVKPNNAGSSFGVSKVNAPDALQAAIDTALEHSSEVLIEQYIKGRELAHGVLQIGGQLIALPITEVISENEFFDYEAKYLGKSRELTPAPNIPESVESEIKSKSIQLFKLFGCRGLTRFDYFLQGDRIFFLEANTLPGLSEASIYPQQLVAAGYTLEQAFGGMLDDLD